jgi:hypothetical protein
MRKSAMVLEHNREQVLILFALNPKTSLSPPNLHANRSCSSTCRNACVIPYVLPLTSMVLIAVSVFAPHTVV